MREAIDNANDVVDGIVHDDCSPGTASGADVITFADGLGTVTITLNGTQLPQITSEMTIDGGGDVTIDADGVTDDGMGESRHVQVAATGNLTVTGLTLQNGFVQDSGFLNIDGGSIHNSGTLTVTDSTLSDNIAQDNLGQPLESGGGGAIYNNGGTVTITGSTLTGNDAAQNFHGGGAILSSQGTVTISDSVLSGNSSARDGGALMALGGTLAVSNSILSLNSSGSGGAIAIFQAHVTVTNSSLSGNTAGGDGGAIFTLQTANVGSVTITGSTLSDNHAGDTGGAININFAVVTIDSTTFSGNTGRVGGAIDQNGATLTVTFSTFAGNSTLVTNVAGGAIAKGAVNVGSATVTDSLVTGSGAQCAGTIGGSNNLVGNSDASCGAAFTAVADVMIRSLADNGGTSSLPGGAHTQTHLPLPGSPAIDAATVGCPPPASDQRGVTRPQGAACDIGSVELSAADPVVSEVVTTILDEANYVAACTLRDAITANLGGTIVGNCEPAADGAIRFAATLLDDPVDTRTIIL
ncbi:MAG: choice-of-anchor Q domain-containing protein, partial [Dehalococcoidia bacterium]